MVVWRYSLDIQEEMLRGSEDTSLAAEGRLGQEIETERRKLSTAFKAVTLETI